MTGNEYLKKRREELGLSIRGFASICDLSPRVVTYYEAGEKQIGSVPVRKGLQMFHVLNLDLKEYFNTYFPCEEEIKDKIIIWHTEHSRVYDCAVLKKRFASRISKIKARSNLSLIDFDRIYMSYRDCFESDVSEVSILSDEQYEQYILPLDSQIREALSPLPENKISREILSAIYHTDFSIMDVAAICQVTRHHLGACLEGKYDIEQIRISLALRLCAALDLDFDDVFRKNINF